MGYEYRRVLVYCDHPSTMSPKACLWCGGTRQKEVWRNVWVPDSIPSVKTESTPGATRVPSELEIWFEEKAQDFINWIGEKAHIFLSTRPKLKNRIEIAFVVLALVIGIAILSYLIIIAINFYHAIRD